jgi:tetratricopeptide (TPR) repeat protein
MNRKHRRAGTRPGSPPIPQGAQSGTRSGAPSVQALFATAHRQHQAGALAEAERLYQQVLAADPNHAECLHLLGVVALQTGRVDLAATLIRRAIAINDRAATYHSNLGTLLAGQGQLEAAIACYRRAIALQPNLPEPYVNLGNALREQGQREAAIDCYRQAIACKPNMPEALVNLGNVLHQLGRLDEAVDCYRRAIESNPSLPAAHNNLCAALRELGRLEEAVASCRRALECQSDYPHAENNLANALREQGRIEEAIACCRRALATLPNFPDAHNTLASALTEQGRYAEALEACQQALALKPDYAEAHCNLGNVLRAQGNVTEAAASYRRAIQFKPDLLEAHNNLGNALREQGRPDEAVACYREALRLKPQHPEAHNNLGMALLALGDMPAGWEEYEFRWKVGTLRGAHRQFTQPQWRGEAAAGRTLLVHAEQGFGDTLQFCRYGALAAGAGLRVVMEVPKPLVRLVRRGAGIDQVVEAGQPLPSFDLHCPMLSLPLALGTTVATIPRPTGYLSADPAQVAIWRDRLAGMGRPGLRVGLSWAGNPRTHSPALAAVDRRRSIDPARLAPLFDVPGVHFISLQKSGPPPPASFPLTDPMPEMEDFDDTASLVANLDLVISVDSAVAHLGAGLGQKVWLLDRFDPCWRWLTGRRDSPWYPTLRIYRQPNPGDWEAVLAEMVPDLRALAAVRF